MMVWRSKQQRPVPLRCVWLGFSLLLIWLGAAWAQEVPRAPFAAAVKQLEAEDAQLRKAAARRLGELGNTDAVPLLAETLRRDRVATVRQAAAEALEPFGHVDAVPALTHALQHDEALGVRLAATRALGQIDSPSVDAVLGRVVRQDNAAHVRRLTARILGRRGDRTTMSILARTLQQDGDAGVRQAAAEALGQMGDVAVVPELARALWHDSALQVRLAVIQNLGQLNHPDVVSILTRALQQDRDPLVRRAAAQALGQIADPAAVSALIYALQQAPDMADRQMAASLLGQSGVKRSSIVTPALMHTLQQDPAAHVRRMAVRSLGQIGDLGTVAVVAHALRHDEAAEVRRMAAHALGQLGDAGTMPALRDAFEHDAAPEVSQAATEALLQIVYPILDRADTRSTPDLQRATDVLHDVVRIVQARASTGGRGVDKEWIAAVAQNYATLTAELAARDNFRGFATLTWLYQRPWLWGPLGYVIGLLFIWCSVLWLRPLWLLRLNDALQPYTDLNLPTWLGSLKLSLRDVLFVGFFHYHQRVLDAWVQAHVHAAQENFSRLDTVKERVAYVPMPLVLDDGVTEQELFDPHVEDFREFFQQPATILLIQGEEGVGKTSLACQLAVSALYPDRQMRLCPHLILPVLLEDDLADAPGQDANTALINAVRDALSELVNAPPRLSVDLVDRLLRQRRILLIVDHLGEMDERTREAIRPQRSDFPAKLLIVTSSLTEQLGSNVQRIMPQRLASTHMAGFVDAYLMLKQTRHRLNDAMYFDLCHRLASLAGERDLSVLVARMFIDQALASASPGEVVSKVTPRNMPELIEGHVNGLYRVVARDALPPVEMLQDTAQQVAWECVKETLCAGRIHISAVQSSLADRMDELQCLIDLGLVVRGGSNHAWVRFALAPIAEYLAGLHLVGQYGESEILWRGFLTRAQAMADAPQRSKTFLLAVHDCCVVVGTKVGVPDFVLPELSKCADLGSEVIESEQFEQRLQRLMRKLVAPQAADRRGAAVALGSMGPEAKAAVFALSQALLDDTDPIVRQTAVWALGRIRNKAATLVLAQMLLKATDVAIRQTAAETLGRIRSETAMSVLTQVQMNDPNPMIRQAATEALGNVEAAPQNPMPAAVHIADSDKALL